MFDRIRHMLIKEFIQVFRDPRTRFVIFAIPVIQTIVFSYAVTTDVKHIKLAILDRDNSVASRELAARFVESGYFDPVARPSDEREVRDLVDRGDAQAVLEIDAGFQGDLQSGRTAVVQLVVDGTDSNTAGIIASYAGRIATDYAGRLMIQRLARLGQLTGPPAQVELDTRAWFNENLESRNYFVPGVIVLIITLVTLLLTAMSIVREKEVGTIEQIMVAPIRRIEFILGKTAPFVLIAFLDVTIISLVAVLWFGVPIRGSIPLLFLATAVYLLTTLSLGLLISTVSRTQQQAMMSVFFFFMPAVLLSGFVFPIANMPVPVQWLTYLNPLRYVITIVRGIFLKGIGLAILWPQFVALVGMGAALLALASRRFHKSMG
ncbi:MAG: putative multidrug ABC transporter permease YbhR [Phycisphaerae bacterium]|nr:putative multidrug ABC transporter permease YbhR [Phycisphaerae bacterium]